MSGPWLLNGGIKSLLRIAAMCSWILLAVLSLVPGQDRPHTGMSGNFEHALAYFLSAGVTRLGFQNTRSRWLLAFSAAARIVRGLSDLDTGPVPRERQLGRELRECLGRHLASQNPGALRRGRSNAQSRGMISGRQIRKARAMLQWDVSKLAKRTGIDMAVILRAESVDGTPSITLAQAGIIQKAFEHAGVRFGPGGGVLMAAGKGES